MKRETTGLEIAVIGMAGRFPGAGSVSQFWDDIVQGRERVGHEPPEGAVRPDFVPAWGRLEGIDRFDAAYFGYTPRDAALLDPQHRLFLQTAHHALEHAGYGGPDRPAHIGVFASCSMSTYLLRNILGNPAAARNASYGEQILGNDKDMLAARTSYHLDLQGPSVTVQSACSSSLVAVHLAGQTLLSRDCEIALAGGVSIQPPQRGYHPEPGGVLSPDGHCRPFDATANGMVPGSGVAVVVLKTLEDALRDNDTIHAVILGTAVNNDGSAKVGFTAPRIDSQAAMVLGAQRFADIEAESIGYVEAHGTGTPLGDPIEVAALTRAFRASTARRGFCGLGSVKALIGHLDAAAGVTGLIKAIQTVRFGVVPPSAYLGEPNPQLHLDDSPFFLPARAQPWPSAGPRRAAVSSIGMGGTNAHAIVEQAPQPQPLPGESDGRWQVLALSARGEVALTRARQQLAHRLSAPDAPDLADAAYTLQIGRKLHPHRIVVLSRDRQEAVRRLRDGGDGVFQRHQDSRGTPIVFVFTGQGAQHPGMGRALSRTEPVFRTALDEMADLLQPHGIALPQLLDADDPHAAQRLTHTASAPPALFALEYALARLLMSWGLQPHAMIGHSVGEYAAATVAGVFSPADAAALVARRGELMGRLPAGAMLAVGRPAAEVAEELDPELVIAADNGPRTCVVAGEIPVVARYAEHLGRTGVDHRALHVSHAFHSPMIEPMLDEFAAAVAAVKREPPTIPFVSCLTGDWITAAEATDASYWAQQAAHTVRFREGVATVLAAAREQILFETGPGQALCGLAREQADPAQFTIVPTLAGPKREQPDERMLAAAVGRAWLAGADLDWRRVHAVVRRRVELPGYPFEPTRHWIEPEGAAAPQDADTPPDEPALEESTSDDVAEQIRGIWSEMLGQSGIGHDDDFFALGGTSMLATRVTGRINDRFGVRLPAGAVFEAPTVAGLATTVWGALAGGEEALLDEIRQLSADAAVDGHRP